MRKFAIGRGAIRPTRKPVTLEDTLRIKKYKLEEAKKERNWELINALEESIKHYEKQLQEKEKRREPESKDKQKTCEDAIKHYEILLEHSKILRRNDKKKSERRMEIDKSERDPRELPRELPKVKYKGKIWYVDERLKQLRNVDNPHEFIDVSDRFIRRFLIRGVGNREEEEIGIPPGGHEFGIEVFQFGGWVSAHSPGQGYTTYSEARDRSIQLTQEGAQACRVVEYDYKDAMISNFNVV